MMPRDLWTAIRFLDVLDGFSWFFGWRERARRFEEGQSAGLEHAQSLQASGGQLGEGDVRVRSRASRGFQSEGRP